MPSSLDRVLSFAHAVRPTGGGYPSDALLARALDAYRGRSHRRLAGLAVSAEGRAFPNLYDAILDGSLGLERVELTLVDPPAPGPTWEFVRPFRSVELFPDGSAELHPFSGPSQRAIARVALRESNEPAVTGWTETLGLAAFADAVEYLRTSGLVPFGLALLLYFFDERVRYEIDLTEDVLLRDARSGRLVPTQRLRTRPRTAWAIDQFVAGGHIPLGPARILEVLSELRSVSVEELAVLAGGSKEAARDALDTLVVEGLALEDPNPHRFRIRLEAFRPWPAVPAAAPRRAPEESPVRTAPDPELQQNMTDLLSGADARATCPLCGDELPPGYRGIVCPRCSSEVSGMPGGP